MTHFFLILVITTSKIFYVKYSVFLTKNTIFTFMKTGKNFILQIPINNSKITKVF